MNCYCPEDGGLKCCPSICADMTGEFSNGSHPALSVMGQVRGISIPQPLWHIHPVSNHQRRRRLALILLSLHCPLVSLSTIRPIKFNISISISRDDLEIIPHGICEFITYMSEGDAPDRHDGVDVRDFNEDSKVQDKE
jgi:hypothetical protein